MNKFFRSHGFFAVFFLSALVLSAGAVSANAVTLYGVTTTGNSLVRFDSATPGAIVTVGAISGLQAGETILAIDTRPATGQLYGLGSTSRLYTINKMTGAATGVGAAFTPALSGTNFGFDFNPVVDRIRVVSNTGQNLRLNPITGMVAATDGGINPGTPSIVGSFYTNNFAGAASTMLFAYDTSTSPDTLYLQEPNSGTLSNPVQIQGTDITGDFGLDFDSGTNRVYAAGVIAGQPIFAVGDLTTLIFTPTPISVSLRGLAVDIGSTVGFSAIGLTTANQLVSFNASRPGVIQSTVAVTGLQAGENLLGIDFRPATGRLFGLGSTSRLYSISVTTGIATAVGAPGAFTLGGTEFGFDFNPVPDRIRVVSNTGQNLRLNPSDGTLSGTDTPLNPGSPSVTAAGYTNSFAGTTSTTLYVVDSGTDTLSLQGSINGTPNSPNGGTITPVGPLGVDVTASNGFDIQPAGNTALAAFQINGETTSKLFSINLTTGAASFIGPIGAATALRGLALTPGTAASGRTSLDFDGDGRADNLVYRLSTNSYFINRSSNGSFYSYQFGLASDIQTPGDFDGDGLADTAVWRASTGVFYVLRSSNGSIQTYQFGLNGDEPIARDYDGDGRTDFAVVRRTGGQMVWYINNSATNTFRIETFGLSSDITSPGDFDGDGRFDLGTFRDNGAAPATFFTLRSTLGFSATNFGLGTDLVVPGDYDGDGRTDFALVRGGSNFTWLILRSSDGGFSQAQFGRKPDLTVQADYDGDGRTDVAVWRQSNGAFYRLRSSNGTVDINVFGQNGDYPVANYDTH